ncbi:MAG: hypothetical protein EBS93_06310 [Chitinophagia bacterium]|jgi:hypothetical protein|nr:hypothetical protein [Chitinophagia bacterium]NCA30310.1 hypothetical protein [Chitinophagia bacterium]
MFLKKNISSFLIFIIVLVAGQTILFNGIVVPIKINFILTVNMMLFAMVYLNYLRLQRVDKNNPNALIRSVMLGTLFKLIVFAGAALTYVKQAKEPVGYPTLLASMSLYLAYTWLEIKEAVQKK